MCHLADLHHANVILLHETHQDDDNKLTIVGFKHLVNENTW